MSHRRIYVDANATYPVSEEHYAQLWDILKSSDGNPSSTHARGRRAKIALEDARAAVAQLVHAPPEQLLFTSGATEANNTVLRGVGQNDPQSQIVVGSADHASLVEPARQMANLGLVVLREYGVDSQGIIIEQQLLDAVNDSTRLVLLAHANNEVGTVQRVGRLAETVKAKNPQVWVHVDAVQSIGKMPIDELKSDAIDSIALSAHKLGGLKGVGALRLKRGRKLLPWLIGGAQERGRRAGTENLPGIVSFGLIADEVMRTWDSRAEAMQLCRNALLAELRALPKAVIHGLGTSPASTSTSTALALSLPNTVNFHIEGVRGDDILLNLDLAGIEASSGSACSSGSARPSRVLLSMGYDEEVALNAVRISFAHTNVIADVAAIKASLRQLLARQLGSNTHG